MNIKRLASSLLCSTICIVMIGSTKVHASGDVAVNAANFPDTQFRNYIEEKIDTDHNGILSQTEINKATFIAISDKGITSLNGIEYFESLSYLSCGFNLLSSLDISKNTALTYLSCDKNQLKALNVSNNLKLKSVSCSDNQLQNLDVSNNAALTSINCDNNQLKEIDVSNNSALSALYVLSNEIKTLDLSRNTALDYLSCGSNLLTSLDISKNTALTYLTCDSNQLKSLDTTHNAKLKSLSCSDNQLKSLDLSKNTALTSINCDNNQLDGLNILNNTALTMLCCLNNKITSLDLNVNNVITYLSCDYQTSTIKGYETYDGKYVVDLSTTPVPVRDGSKIQMTDGGMLSGTKVTYSEIPSKVTYNYSCGSKEMDVTLTPTIYLNDAAKDKIKQFTETLYKTTLDRDSDASGLDYWVNELAMGKQTGAQVVHYFVFGKEFTAKNYCNEHFLTHLYKAIFSRDGDTAGLKYWEDKMSAGMTREEVLNGFLGGKEFKALCDNAGISVGSMPALPAHGTIQTWKCPEDNKMDNGIGNFVLRMYTTCLGRDAEKEGASYWITQLNANKIGGTAVAEKFFMGTEFTNKKLSDSEYLDRLYATIFDRPSDASGKSYWLSKLQSGSSRKDVLYGFASGTEWANICKNYGIKK